MDSYLFPEVTNYNIVMKLLHNGNGKNLSRLRSKTFYKLYTFSSIKHYIQKIWFDLSQENLLELAVQRQPRILD